MALDDFIPEIESSEGGANTAEVSNEAVEKASEASKKAGARVAKTQKDEKKAKKYDFLLAGFLVKIIVDKKYDVILDSLFKSMDHGYTSNFVVGILSIINTEISDKIRELSDKSLITFNYSPTENLIFDDSNLPKEIQDRINYWIEDVINSVTIEYSSIQTKRIIELLIKDDKILSNYTATAFGFFLKQLNISISENKALNISDFIISEVKKQLGTLELEEI